MQKAIIKKGFSKNTWNKGKLQNRYRARWAKGETGLVPMLVWPYACLALCPPSSVPVLQLTLVPSVFGESFYDDGFLHNPVSILHPLTILLCRSINKINTVTALKLRYVFDVTFDLVHI